MALFFVLIACWLNGAHGWAALIDRVDLIGGRIVVRPAPAVEIVAAMVGQDAAIRDGEIVLDLARPSIEVDALPTGQAAGVALRLRSLDDAGFARAAADGQLIRLPPFSFALPAPPRVGYRVAASIPAASGAITLPMVYGDRTRPLVVIDAGHGGVDPGAAAPDGSLREKDATLAIARAVRDRLVAGGRVRVALTRDDDRFLILQERYGIARKLGADLFISIHCDSAAATEASGATAYTLSEVASDKQAARLAARENKADIIAGVNLGEASADVSSILIDLTQRETMDKAADFARLLGREAQPLLTVRPNFHRMASLVVLKAPDMPSILFETGYLSHPADVAFLGSPAGRDAIAESIQRATIVYFARQSAAR